VLHLFNSLNKKIEGFHPAEKHVTIFTCGPSVYQRAHIGNFRTFLFEDILVRYLKYTGYSVARGMNLTDIEDKAIKEAVKKNVSLNSLSKKNIKEFVAEMRRLRMQIPDYLPRASGTVDEAAEIISKLLERKRAYRHGDNIYFDPLKFRGFGKLYGLDMTKWPAEKRRFHRDTYTGARWNLGDFILWHGYKKGDACFWDTSIGKGRPAWNIQDPGMIAKFINRPLSIYCGGVDNLIRHHDYTRAVLESFRPYPMARFWLHCQNLCFKGRKMSKSKGNILYTDDLLAQGYDISEIRFFLIYGHYRKQLSYSDRLMRETAARLRNLKQLVRLIRIKSGQKHSGTSRYITKLKGAFVMNMNKDLNVREAFGGLHKTLSNINIDKLYPGDAAGIIADLKEIDKVFQVIF